MSAPRDALISAEMLDAQMVRVASVLESAKASMERLIAERDALHAILQATVDADFVVPIELYERCRAMFANAGGK